MAYYKKLVGERIYLSPMCMEDAETYVEWLSDRSVTDGIHGTSKLLSVEQEKEWIRKNLEKGEYIFSIVLKENDKLIGNCSIMNLNRTDRTGTLGILIGEEQYRNNGYGAEALRLLLDYGFNILNLHNINLGVFSFNERAINCYKKVGFKECGRRRESYYLDGKYHDEITLDMLEDEYRNMYK